MTDTFADTWLTIRLARIRFVNAFQESAARRLPKWLVYRAVILAYSRAWHEAKNKTPDELTFAEIVDPWTEDR